MIAGEKVTSQVVPTRLYGRESLEYEMYEFTAQDMLSGGEGFIYGFFDNCFYRYRNEIVDSKDINLKRLFYEIISRMLYALKNRYMSQEQFNEISRMIDILFENGVMRYTDASRFVRSIARLQSNMNETHRSGYVVSRNNRLFSHMKDRAILSQAFRHTMETREYNFGRGRIFDFTIETVNYGTPDPGAMERLIGNFDKAGFDNAAMYLYDKPVLYDGTDPEPLPELMYLKCVVRDKTLYVIPEERQECPVDRIYTRSVIPRAQKGYISFPLFYGRYLFGVLVACVTRALIDNGEYVSSQVSRMIYLNWCGKE
ncbi:MAG: hypothetical protein J5842_08975 [Lachnospiraceae bacterium]|nr:hypothetical protein [Lachnospiraceae bacterium]